uniref:Uncharacterized protein n=1 Tax=Mustela putorius furo TaxID=9669 RepID=M3XQZ5_MUSPF
MQTNPSDSGGPFPVSGSCTDAKTAAWGVWGPEFVVLQVCVFLRVSAPDSAAASGPPAKAGPDFGEDPGEREARLLPAVPARGHPGLGGGRRGLGRGGWSNAGAPARSGSRPSRLPLSRRLGSGAWLPPGAFSDCGGSPRFWLGVGWWWRGSVRAPLPPPRALFPSRRRALTWQRGSTRAGSPRAALTWGAGVRAGERSILGGGAPVSSSPAEIAAGKAELLRFTPTPLQPACRCAVRFATPISCDY